MAIRSTRRRRTGLQQLLLAAAAFVACTDPSVAREEVRAAVAANFTETARELARLFEAVAKAKVVPSFGATGHLYAQISQGAPFDVFLAADRSTPARAIAERHAVPGTAFTYAVGRLVLYSREPTLVRGEGTLREARFTRLAIANPATAPYGAAAIETMRALGVLDVLAPKLVNGTSIAQTFQFVATGNAELGFVALAQVVSVDGGSRWMVPGNLHAPIEQDAVLLKPGAQRAAGRAFLAFLRGSEARAVIEKSGYGIE